MIERGRGSGYIAHVPALPGRVPQGRSRDEALRNIKEAVEAYAKAFLTGGLPLPTEAGREAGEGFPELV